MQSQSVSKTPKTQIKQDIICISEPPNSSNGSAMASMSMDIATTFLGLAKRNPIRMNSIRTAVFPRLWENKSYQGRTILACCSVNSRIVSLKCTPKPKNFSRRFTASAATTSTPQSEDSDVLTKIPPDDRIPATIITGFLGSGKVIFHLVIIIYFDFSSGEIVLMWHLN